MEKLLSFLVPMILITSTVILFHLISKKINKGNSYKKYGEVSACIKHKCPKCGQVMENGFVAIDRGISYRANEKKRPGIFASPNGFLKNTFNRSLSIKENLAWRCENCSYVLIDHSSVIGK